MGGGGGGCGGGESASGSRAVWGKPKLPSRLGFFCSLRSLGAEDVAALFPSGWESRVWIAEMGSLGETAKDGEKVGETGGPRGGEDGRAL